MKKSEIIFGAVRVPLDFIATMGAFLLAYFIRPLTDLIPGVQFEFFPEQLPPFKEYLTLTVSSSIFLVILFAIFHLYTLKVTHKFISEIFRIIFFASTWLMFIIAYYFLIVHQLFFSRIALAQIWFFTIVFITAGRWLVLFIQWIFLKFNIGRRQVLFIGVTRLADEFYSSFQKDHSYRVIGALAGAHNSRKKGLLKVIGTLDQLESIVKKYKIDEIIQADTDISDDEAKELHSFCRANQIKFSFIPDLIRLQRTNVEVQIFGSAPLISLKQTPLEGWGHVFKRIFDFIAALIITVLLTPLWLIMPIIIKLNSRGPAFYKSKRQYKHRVFNIYKFRTMVPNAEALKKDLLKENERSGPMFKIKNDPRVTKLGRFLRKTSIDELPQLFNVLLGNMSLVGPRPHLPEEVKKYERHHYEVFALKPGITGLAQISGRSNLDFEEEVRRDVYYIENWSLWLDIKLIIKSIGVIFRADGH